jgi:hypothetical protein
MEKTFQEIKKEVEQLFNTIYDHDAVNLVKGIARMKKFYPQVEFVTEFVNDLYVTTKKAPNVPASLRIYCLLNDIDSADKFPTCDMCNHPKLFLSITSGFALSCGSRRCYQKHSDTNKKRQATAISKYGSLHNAYHETSKQTILKKYNVDNISKLDFIKEKKIATSRDHWGTDYPWQSEQGKQMQKLGVQLKYNVTNISQLEFVKNKKIATTQKNWNVDNPSQSPIIIQKISDTHMKNWGVRNVSQHYDIDCKKRKTLNKQYILPDGSISYIEGYEQYILDYMFKERNINIDDITLHPNLTISFLDNELKTRVWLPDIYDKISNSLIDVKSIFILLHLKNVHNRVQATIDAGYNYKIMIYDNHNIYELAPLGNDVDCFTCTKLTNINDNTIPDIIKYEIIRSGFKLIN